MHYIKIYLKSLSIFNLDNFNIYSLSLLFGFFISTGLSTITTQTGDWSIIAAATIVTSQEIISKVIYRVKSKEYGTNGSAFQNCLKCCNAIKIGILYGLLVDAFKLGS
uniref:Uncharacterized protein ycf20 n=1 Tax=Neogoniolithon spectabile TaxID=231755 RepID=A0A3G3MGZ0_9FLOR|nr:hypothetical protein [Neogoniolithon spectabile]AYR06108.1 hypothetical protein [Neogoniolithon spectabile]